MSFINIRVNPELSVTLQIWLFSGLQDYQRRAYNKSSQFITTYSLANEIKLKTRTKEKQDFFLAVNIVLIKSTEFNRALIEQLSIFTVYPHPSLFAISSHLIIIIQKGLPKRQFQKYRTTKYKIKCNYEKKKNCTIFFIIIFAIISICENEEII